MLLFYAALKVSRRLPDDASDALVKLIQGAPAERGAEFASRILSVRRRGRFCRGRFLDGSLDARCNRLHSMQDGLIYFMLLHVQDPAQGIVVASSKQLRRNVAEGLQSLDQHLHLVAVPAAVMLPVAQVLIERDLPVDIGIERREHVLNLVLRVVPPQPLKQLVQRQRPVAIRVEFLEFLLAQRKR